MLGANIELYSEVVHGRLWGDEKYRPTRAGCPSTSTRSISRALVSKLQIQEQHSKICEHMRSENITHNLFYSIILHAQCVCCRTRDVLLLEVDLPIEMNMLRHDLGIVCLSSRVERHGVVHGGSKSQRDLYAVRKLIIRFHHVITLRECSRSFEASQMAQRTLGIVCVREYGPHCMPSSLRLCERRCLTYSRSTMKYYGRQNVITAGSIEICELCKRPRCRNGEQRKLVSPLVTGRCSRTDE